MNRTLKRTSEPGIWKITTPRARGGESVRYRVAYRVPGLGQRTKSFERFTDAKAFRQTLGDPGRLRQLRELERGRITLGAYFPAWLERKRRLAPSTHARYEFVGRRYIVPSRLGSLLISAISRDDVERWIADLQRQGVPGATIDKTYRTLRACLETAVSEGKAITNAARRIELPRPDDREPFFLTQDQVEAIANAVPDRHKALVYFLAFTGARIGEASALRLKNLDLTRGVVRIVESSAEVGGKKLPAGKTKTRTTRSITLPPPLLAELAAHLEVFGARDGNGDLDPEGWVFSHRGGGQIRQGNWRSRIFQPSCERVGVVRQGRSGKLEPPRVHDLRHTAASLTAKAGYSLHEVKELLGHSTIKTTSDLYLHLFEDAKEEKAGRLGELMEAAQSARATVLPFSRGS
jgi:integrase